jgi:uncharacterized protein
MIKYMHVTLEDRLEALLSWFKDKKSALVALSGGVDSALVAYAAYSTLKDRALAVTADYSSLSRYELEIAESVSREIGIRHRVITYDQLSDERFINNDPMRCFHCRDMLARHLRGIAMQEGIEVIVDGTNADDTREYRPGLKAMHMHGIMSPLLQLGIGKDEVRALARYVGLSVHDKPSESCLASRVAYGISISRERLEMVESAEYAVKSIFNVRQVRVRLHEHGKYIIARIEVGRDERKLLFDEEKLDRLDYILKSIGFTHVSIDAKGYKSGSLNVIQ